MPNYIDLSAKKRIVIKYRLSNGGKLKAETPFSLRPQASTFNVQRSTLIRTHALPTQYE